MSPVFNEAKYRALLEKLEISEVELSAIQKKNFDFRIDSEYFFKEHLKLDYLLEYKKTDLLSNLSSKISDGTHFTPEYTNSGVPFLSAINVQKNVLDWDRGYQFISQTAHQLLYKRCDPKTGDVLLRKVGVGDRLACVVPEINFEFSIFVSVALVRTKNINPFFLSTFINSCYGQKQLLRFNKGIGQPDLHLEDIARLRVVIPSSDFQIKIEKLVKDGVDCFTKAKNACMDSEQLLLQELGLTDWQPDDESVATKSFADFRNSGRLDAEYYQPKYDCFLAKIKEYSNGTTTVKEEFNQNQEQIKFSLSKYNYVEIGDINVGNGEASFNELPTEELPANAKYSVKQGDILISKVRPYRGAVSVIDFEPQNLIASGAFTILQENGNIKKEVLAILLRTPIYRDWLLKWNVGSSYPVIKDDDILNLTIPTVRNDIQEQIAAKVQESFALRKESKRLLDLAKHTVEVAIEQGEDAAMKLLERCKDA